MGAGRDRILCPTYVLAGALVDRPHRCAGLLLVGVSAHAAIVWFASSAAVAGDPQQLFSALAGWRAARRRRAGGLSGGPNRGGDSQVSASNKGMRPGSRAMARRTVDSQRAAA